MRATAAGAFLAAVFFLAAMAGFWAIGLAIHAVASVAQRGYEN